jgi:hypothetical protein
MVWHHDTWWQFLLLFFVSPISQMIWVSFLFSSDLAPRSASNANKKEDRRSMALNQWLTLIDIIRMEEWSSVLLAASLDFLSQDTISTAIQHFAQDGFSKKIGLPTSHKIGCLHLKASCEIWGHLWIYSLMIVKTFYHSIMWSVGSSMLLAASLDFILHNTMLPSNTSHEMGLHKTLVSTLHTRLAAFTLNLPVKSADFSKYLP